MQSAGSMAGKRRGQGGGGCRVDEANSIKEVILSISMDVFIHQICDTRDQLQCVRWLAEAVCPQDEDL